MLCSDQRLQFQTFPLENVSDITNHHEVAIDGSKNIVYSISVGIKSKQMYTVIIIYEGVDVVQVLNESFSEFIRKSMYYFSTTTYMNTFRYI